MGFNLPSLVFLIIIGSSYGTESTIDIECTFGYHEFALIGIQYTCFVENDLNILGPNVNISNILGTHEDDLSFESVIGLSIENMRIEFLPVNLGDIFPNLIALKVKKCGLKQLFHDDLKSMPKLRYLNLDENDIEDLNDGLFVFNPHLQLAWFNGNKIKRIGANLVDSFNKLDNLDLRNNNCVSKSFAHLVSVHVSTTKKHPTSLILSEIKDNCSRPDNSTVEIDERSDVTTTESTTSERKTNEDKITHLNNQVNSYRAELRTLRLRFVEEASARNKTLKMLEEHENKHSLLTNEIDIGSSQKNKEKLEIQLKNEEEKVKNLRDELKRMRDIKLELFDAKNTIKRMEDEKYQLSELRKGDSKTISELKDENLRLLERIKELEEQKEVPKISVRTEEDKINETIDDPAAKSVEISEDADLLKVNTETSTSTTVERPVETTTKLETTTHYKFSEEEYVEGTTIYDYYS